MGDLHDVTIAPTTDQRQAILAAAIDLLSAGGPEALRVRDIAEAAGCSTMGVYSHFGGKFGIVDAIFGDGFARFRDATAAAIDQTSEPASHALRLAPAYRSWALSNPSVYKVMFDAAIPGFTPSLEALSVAAGAFEVVAGAVAHDQSIGLLRTDDPSTIAWGLWGTVHGLVMLEIAGMAPPIAVVSAEEAFSDATAAVLGGFAP